ncbi:MAG: DUF3179 domain-containing protein [Magnetovibrio sp.]|nr:DUF3179 domain-containing protein [Magnetovibrio sp.]
MAYARYPRRFVLRTFVGVGVLAWLGLCVCQGAWATNPFANDVPRSWTAEWPDTDFSKSSVAFGDIMSGGPPKDGIPAIDQPNFTNIASIKTIPDTEPVIALTLNGKTKVYPLRILTWHEIVNDTHEGIPVAVTYCPLCNAGIVFDSRLGDGVLTFGTTGKLRNSDLVMYDRQTESWWQQFSGEAIIGQLQGQTLKMLPSRMEAFGKVKERAPDAQVLVATSSFSRPYGSNPYVGYDTSVRPFLYGGDLPPDISPMMRVVVVDGKAWTLPFLKKRKKVTDGDVVLSWTSGQNSALDTRYIYKGRDVGNVTVQQKTDSGLEDKVHHVTFAFVFHAFHPDGLLIKD